jgi:hypothetical protein
MPLWQNRQNTAMPKKGARNKLARAKYFKLLVGLLNLIFLRETRFRISAKKPKGHNHPQTALPAINPLIKSKPIT